jgi:hypothetical protein
LSTRKHWGFRRLDGYDVHIGAVPAQALGDATERGGGVNHVHEGIDPSFSLRPDLVREAVVSRETTHDFS